MAAEHYCADRYYCADSENGHHIDDPSEDALFDLISELDHPDNTFIVIQPDQDDPHWFASVAVLDEGGYEIVRRDATRSEHEVTTDTSISGIANDLTIWLAARDFSGRPSPQDQTSSSAQQVPRGAAAAGPRAPQPGG